MASQKNCPECQGTMVLTAGVGGLFWRCQKCGKKIPLASGALDEQGDCSGK
ncbi:MAG: zf-TFIIB domain-containing protein [Geobacteraceae bacterium]